jgi:hypothetical protein
MPNASAPAFNLLFTTLLPLPTFVIPRPCESGTSEPASTLPVTFESALPLPANLAVLSPTLLLPAEIFVKCRPAVSGTSEPASTACRHLVLFHHLDFLLRHLQFELK